MADIFIVTWNYSDYEGGSTSLVKAFTDPAKAKSLSNDLDEAVSAFAKIRQPLPSINTIRIEGMKGGVVKYDPVKREAWDQECIAIRKANAAKAVELHNLIVASHGDLPEDVLSRPNVDDMSLGWVGEAEYYAELEIVELI